MPLFKAQFLPSSGAQFFAKGVEQGSTMAARRAQLDEKIRQFDATQGMRDAQERGANLANEFLSQTIDGRIQASNAQSAAAVELADTSVEQANLNVALGQASLFGAGLQNLETLQTMGTRRAKMQADLTMAQTAVARAQAELEDFQANSVLRGTERQAALLELQKRERMAQFGLDNVEKEQQLMGVALSQQLSQALGQEASAEALAAMIPGMRGRLPDYVVDALEGLQRDPQYQGNPAALGNAVRGVLTDYAQGAQLMFVREAQAAYSDMTNLLSDPQLAGFVTPTEMSSIASMLKSSPANALITINGIVGRLKTAKTYNHNRVQGITLVGDVGAALSANPSLYFNNENLSSDLTDRYTETGASHIQKQQQKLQKLYEDQELDAAGMRSWIIDTFAPFQDRGILPNELSQYQGMYANAVQTKLRDNQQQPPQPRAVPRPTAPPAGSAPMIVRPGQQAAEGGQGGDEQPALTDEEVRRVLGTGSQGGQGGN